MLFKNTAKQLQTFLFCTPTAQCASFKKTNYKKQKNVCFYILFFLPRHEKSVLLERKNNYRKITAAPLSCNILLKTILKLQKGGYVFVTDFERNVQPASKMLILDLVIISFIDVKKMI